MRKDALLQKKEVANNEMAFEWRYGQADTNLILENAKLGVQFLRYLVVSANGEVSYDTISIKESGNNTVIVVRNQKKELGLIWEWRPVPARWFWACPRGFGDPDDVDNIAAAKREMLEEIGNCKIINSRKIGALYQNTTFYENPVGLVLLDVEVLENKTNQEEGIFEFRFFSIDEIKRMVREDKIEDTFTLSALMRYIAL